MLRIKKLDIFIVKSFVLLFIGTFFICLFIFMMQFLWRYVDELVGKGLEISILAKFFFYSALTLVPASLPLAVLLASLITFGNFGERYELLAMKAAGISLLRIMRPLIVFAIFLSCISFYFQNIIGPKAQVDLWTLLISMKQKSPELDIPEGVFYDEIEGYNLYVKNKNRDNGMLYNIMIYNTKDGFDNTRIILADSGKLEMTADKQHLYLHLYSGEQFENLRSQNTSADNVPYRRESFREKHTIIEFNTEFNMIDGSFINDQSVGKNMCMLQASIDSMSHRTDSIGRTFYRDVMTMVYPPVKVSKDDSVKIQQKKARTVRVDSLFNALPLLQKQKVVTNALSKSENAGSDWQFKSFMLTEGDTNIRKHETEWHNKITISLTCLIFFFIGAPLGAIIRKGGLGMPVVVSVAIFIFYYIVNNTGYKMARDGNWDVWIGMWISTIVLAPIGIFLTYKSNKDSVVLNADVYISWIKRIAGIRSQRHITKKEVIIQDPDYSKQLSEIKEIEARCSLYIKNHKLTSPPNYIKIWTKGENDDEIEQINSRLEENIEELSNSKYSEILNLLNAFPVISENAHKSPFKAPWMNLVAALFIPVGLLFYFRVWIFRYRLNKDMLQIIQTSENLEKTIENNLKR